jgi:hypothetical protein
MGEQLALEARYEMFHHPDIDDFSHRMHDAGDRRSDTCPKDWTEPLGVARFRGQIPWFANT